MVNRLFDALNIPAYGMAGAYWEATDGSMFAYLPGRSMSIEEACQPPKVLDSARAAFCHNYNTVSILLFRVPAQRGAFTLLDGRPWGG
jgi:hypothetical protein